MSIFNVERDAVPVGLLGNQSTTLTVLSGDTLYYADNSQVSASSNQGSLTSGGSATFTNNVWIVSASASSVSQSFTAASSGSSGSGGSGGSSPAIFSWPDVAVVNSSAGPYRTPAAQTISNVYLNANSGPVGSNLVAVVSKNGSAIATLTMPAGTTTEQNATPGTALIAGDKLTVQLTSVGSTTPASGVTVQVNF